MTIKTWLAETWMHVSATGILIFGLVMLVAPFLISLVANIGRPIPRAVRTVNSRGMLATPRRALS
jgi:phage-related minor tail protein